MFESIKNGFASVMEWTGLSHPAPQPVHQDTHDLVLVVKSLVTCKPAITDAEKRHIELGMTVSAAYAAGKAADIKKAEEAMVEFLAKNKTANHIQKMRSEIGLVLSGELKKWVGAHCHEISGMYILENFERASSTWEEGQEKEIGNWMEALTSPEALENMMGSNSRMFKSVSLIDSETGGELPLVSYMYLPILIRMRVPEDWKKAQALGEAGPFRSITIELSPQPEYSLEEAYNSKKPQLELSDIAQDLVKLFTKVAKKM